MQLKYITLRGERHPLCFSLHAADRICDEFGSFESMVSAIQGTEIGPKIKAIVKTLNILLESGRKYCELMDIALPPPIKGDVSALIDITDGTAVSLIFETMANDTERTVEAKGKNSDPTPAK